MNVFDIYEKYVRPEMQPILEEKPDENELFDVEEKPGEKEEENGDLEPFTINEEAMVEKIVAKVAEMLAKKGEE